MERLSSSSVPKLTSYLPLVRLHPAFPAVTKPRCSKFLALSSSESACLRSLPLSLSLNLSSLFFFVACLCELWFVSLVSALVAASVMSLKRGLGPVFGFPRSNSVDGHVESGRWLSAPRSPALDSDSYPHGRSFSLLPFGALTLGRLLPIGQRICFLINYLIF